MNIIFNRESLLLHKPGPTNVFIKYCLICLQITILNLYYYKMQNYSMIYTCMFSKHKLLYIR